MIAHEGAKLCARRRRHRATNGEAHVRTQTQTQNTGTRASDVQTISEGQCTRHSRPTLDCILSDRLGGIQVL
jgi:hypothetical protein